MLFKQTDKKRERKKTVDVDVDGENKHGKGAEQLKQLLSSPSRAE